MSYGRLISTYYYGGKNRPILQDAIISRLESNRGYLEPFCGSCAILLNRAVSRFEIINDLDDLVVNFFRVLRDRPNELIEALSLTPFARQELENSVVFLENGGKSLDDVERARCWYTAISMSMRGKMSGRFPTGKGNSNGSPSAAFAHRVRSKLRQVAERLASVAIENTDAVDFNCAGRGSCGLDDLLRSTVSYANTFYQGCVSGRGFG